MNLSVLFRQVLNVSESSDTLLTKTLFLTFYLLPQSWEVPKVANNSWNPEKYILCIFLVLCIMSLYIFLYRNIMDFLKFQSDFGLYTPKIFQYIKICLNDKALLSVLFLRPLKLIFFQNFLIFCAGLFGWNKHSMLIQLFPSPFPGTI